MAATDLTIRRATAKDADRISGCVRAAYQHFIVRIGRPPGPMLEDYDRIIRDHEVHVAEDGQGLAGVLVLGRTEEGFKIFNVAVDPSRQKTGLGRTLLELAEAEARRQGYRSVYLSTHEKMTENQAIYAHMGYKEYDRREEEGYARVFMRKQLSREEPPAR